MLFPMEALGHIGEYLCISVIWGTTGIWGGAKSINILQCWRLSPE